MHEKTDWRRERATVWIDGIRVAFVEAISIRGGLVSVLKKICAVRNVVLILAALAVVVGTVNIRSVRAQDSVDRKVKSKVAPQYPEIARKLGLTGTVRLQIVVSPSGSVKETKVIGGHPILVTAAEDAVKKWKFDPAAGDTTQVVEVKFDSEY